MFTDLATLPTEKKQKILLIGVSSRSNTKRYCSLDKILLTLEKIIRDIDCFLEGNQFAAISDRRLLIILVIRKHYYACFCRDPLFFPPLLT